MSDVMYAKRTEKSAGDSVWGNINDALNKIWLNGAFTAMLSLCKHSYLE